MASVVVLDVQRPETNVSDWRRALAHRKACWGEGRQNIWGGGVGEELVIEWG